MVAGLTLLTACLLLATTALATEINGSVKGNDGYSLAGVRVDFFGPTKRVVLTDAAGDFNVTLPGGVYQVRVSSGMRRHESKHRVMDDGNQELKLKVDW